MTMDQSETHQQHRRQIEELSDRYGHYIGALHTHRLKVVTVPGDGNCLFRAVAHQVYGDHELHDLVRQRCLDFMEADAGFFSQFVEGLSLPFVTHSLSMPTTPDPPLTST